MTLIVIVHLSSLSRNNIELKYLRVISIYYHGPLSLRLDSSPSSRDENKSTITYKFLILAFCKSVGLIICYHWFNIVWLG